MDTSTIAICGLLSAAVSFAGFILYIKKILAGKTRPEKSSWWIWTILMLVAFLAQLAAGATWSLLLTGTLLIGNLAIAILSRRYGYGKFKKIDISALLLTALGLWLWWITKNPLVALLIIICVDFSGNILTMLKTWRAPYSENTSTWILTTFGALFGTLAVASMEISRLIFPVYVIIANLMVLGVIYYRRGWRKVRIAEGRHKKYKSI
jgi:hypothetical protein